HTRNLWNYTSLFPSALHSLASFPAPLRSLFPSTPIPLRSLLSAPISLPLYSSPLRSRYLSPSPALRSSPQKPNLNHNSTTSSNT
ncbi:hypothetical protein PGTUg99_000217, partial [Puccinia graminis f. sp. tritici]